MEPVGSDLSALAAMTKWPTPNTDGTTTITPELLRRVRAVLAGLINYIAVQLVRCKKKDVPAP